MIKNLSLLVVLFAVLVNSQPTVADTTSSPEKGVFALSDRVRANLNTRQKRLAIHEHSLRGVALKRNFVAKHNTSYSYEVPRERRSSAKIRNQKQSGRCWIYATENVLRSKLFDHGQKNLGDLSTSFVNYHALRNKVYQLIDMTKSPQLQQKPVASQLSEGGWHHWALEIVRKHGIVPKMVMDSTADSHNSGVLLNQLETIIAGAHYEMGKVFAAAQQQAKQEALQAKKQKKMQTQPMDQLDKQQESAQQPKQEQKARQQAQQQELRAIAARYKAKAVKLLDTAVGRPPARFTVDGKQYTPRSYARDYLKLQDSDLDYVMLSHLPMLRAGALQKVKEGRMPEMEVYNVSLETMRKATLNTLKQNEAVFFATNVSSDNPFRAGLEKSDPKQAKGILSIKAFNYQAFGPVPELSKTSRLTAGISRSNHAMAITGVDEKQGKIIKWKVDNSWGKKTGDKGHLHMYDDFFAKYVTVVTVPRHVLSPEVLSQIDRQRVMVEKKELIQQAKMKKLLGVLSKKVKPKAEVADPPGWTHPRKRRLVLEIIAKRITPAQAAEKHNIPLETVQAWYKNSLKALSTALISAQDRKDREAKEKRSNQRTRPKPAKS